MMMTRESHERSDESGAGPNRARGSSRCGGPGSRLAPPRVDEGTDRRRGVRRTGGQRTGHAVTQDVST